MSQSLKAAILVVSTTAAEDPATDAAEETLRSVFDQDGGSRWQVVETKIVPDSVPQIQKQIMSWADVADHVHLIVTTGGTGFAVSDQTPEVWYGCSPGVLLQTNEHIGCIRTFTQTSSWSSPRDVGHFLKCDTL